MNSNKKLKYKKMESPPGVTLTKRDYFLVSFIGLSFALFSIPILKNINLPFLKLNLITVLFLVIFFVIFANLALWIASIIGRRIPIAFQFAKFGAVGAFNTFLDWGVLNILIALTGTAAGIGYTVFKGISFIVANISSYLWNKHWTFGSQETANAQEMGKFFGVSVIGLIINISLASIVVNVIGPQAGMSPERWANVGALLATVVSLIWNFVGYKLWVFRK
ncbi:MAG: GtrA family protein [Candidatus Moranbacteria bacterium]|nr:GtrA family protein [Candidatus Moranbacteria bacterium]